MTIDWEEIWRVHSPYYKDGEFKLELENGTLIEFLPGPAFGDGSHSTTNLVLKHLSSHVEGKRVVDLGSGSGVLSMAAARLGALEVFALEIDEDAITTMKQNLTLNHLTDIKVNKRPADFDLVLLNMISSEQKIALKSHPYLLKKGTEFLISGILKEETEEILQYFQDPEVISSSNEGQWAFLHIKV